MYFIQFVQALEEALKEDFSVLKNPEQSIEDFKAAVTAKTFEELRLDENNSIGYEEGTYGG